ncbi:uncharacterized protein LOC114190562 [Vigna unguiculata]|uniref:Uncharacterized protein n=1 Tax=Vigna unguiculata TaxID=3917 RepID=A0A4D6N2L2_VIGUN|nr:uncharacterized protein LOC114190562 [Vigna unguiculata]QCE08006.1 hypothetical protein DEO72_LG9g3030 [Vigna unguiculata]
MDSSSSSSGASVSEHAKVVPKQCDIFHAGKYSSSRRTHSSSSSSSFESFYFPEDPLLSPASPLRFSGVPFSWEHLPGIPKKQNSKKKLQESSLKLLPLPPPTTTRSSKNLTHEETRVRKKNSVQSVFQRDPFFAALVECSKDDDSGEETSRNLWKVPRSVSDRFGFINLYGSCKRTCAVSESLVYLPSSRRSTCEEDVSPRSL